MRRHEAGRRRVRCGAGHPEKQAQVIDRPPQSMVMPVLLLFVALLVPRCAFAQQGVRPGDGRKRAQAVRVPSGSIDVNGRLDDSAWRDVPALTEFVQKEPVEGATPTDRMEVRFAYDDRALYVGARMYSTDPIRSPLGRRDDGDQAEHLIVSLDPYLDRRTASTFGVTAARCQARPLLPAGRRLSQRRRIQSCVAGADEHRSSWMDRRALDPFFTTALH